MKAIAMVLVLLAALPVAAGYLGGLHPAGDSFAVFRAQGAGLLVLMALGALLAGARRAGIAGIALAVFAAVPLVFGYWAEGVPGPLRLYQKNMLFRNSDLPGLEADIRAADVAVLTLQEVSTPNLALLTALEDVLPHQMVCTFATVGGVAVATRLMPVPGQEICAPGLAAMQVEGPEGRLWLVSVHLHWPWPYGQAAQVADLVPVLAGLDGPVVMAGDFNMVRWAAALRAMAGAARVGPAGRVHGSYTGFAPWLLLPIDHVLARGGGTVETRPGLGSDHLGLLARITP
jgi:endonuclease/exonuclease/phosphatase (EEP) superfamily protein YafD